MDQAIHNKIVSFIWGIADDVLRDLFKRGKYPDVILPMFVLRRLDAVQEGDAGSEVGQVVFDQVQPRMLLDPELLDAPEVHRAGAAVRAVDLIAFCEEKFGEIRAILARDSGDERAFHDSAISVADLRS